MAPGEQEGSWGVSPVHMRGLGLNWGLVTKEERNKGFDN